MALYICITTHVMFGDSSVESLDAFVAEKKAMNRDNGITASDIWDMLNGLVPPVADCIQSIIGVFGEEEAMDPAETIKVEPMARDDDSCSSSPQSPVAVKKELPDYSSDGNETSQSRGERNPNPSLL